MFPGALPPVLEAFALIRLLLAPISPVLSAIRPHYLSLGLRGWVIPRVIYFFLFLRGKIPFWVPKRSLRKQKIEAVLNRLTQ